MNGELILSQDTTLVLKVPQLLYESWLEITYNLITVDKITEQEAQKRVYAMLRSWILANYPIHKLCAFEEIDTKTAEKLKLSRGMYLKLREMTGPEIALSMEMNKKGKLGKDGNPQWILELNHIPELLTYEQLLDKPGSITESTT